MDKLPQFQTLDELVAFWDDHDFTGYVDEMEEVGEEGLPGQKPDDVASPRDVLLDRGIIWKQKTSSDP